jgi:hypothetical protein
MLFLAVFCGFLAEYQLEHKIEKDREKQFIRSLVEDLKADTLSITRLLEFRRERHRMYDSLTAAIVENKYRDIGSSVYYWGRNISRYVFFYSADGTLQQLKNSGGLRLITRKEVRDKIMNYDVLYRHVLHLRDLEEQQINEYRLQAGDIFNAGIFRKIANLEDTVLFHRPEGNPQLKNDSPELLNQMVNKLNYWVAGSSFLLNMLKQQKQRAAELIILINKAYYLD